VVKFLNLTFKQSEHTSSQTPLVQLSLAQSESMAQASPGPQGSLTRQTPPQSTSVSVWFLTPSPQLAV
jgi:hypothetical protein